MSKGNWIKLHRELACHEWLNSRSDWFACWVHILLGCNSETGLIDLTVIYKDLNHLISRDAWKHFLERCVEDGMLSIEDPYKLGVGNKRNKYGSVINFLKYNPELTSSFNIESLVVNNKLSAENLPDQSLTLRNVSYGNLPKTYSIKELNKGKACTKNGLPHLSNDLYGIYILIKNDIVVYVGQSKSNIKARILSHLKDKDFDSYFIVNCEFNDIDNQEFLYVVNFLPSYNKCLPTSSWMNLENVQKELIDFDIEYIKNSIYDLNVAFVVTEEKVLYEPNVIRLIVENYKASYS